MCQHKKNNRTVCPRFNNGCRSMLCSGNISKKSTQPIAPRSDVQILRLSDSSDCTGHREYIQSPAFKDSFYQMI